MVIKMTLSKGVGDLQLNTKEKVTLNLNRLWIYPHPPSNSNLQDYYSFTRESQPKPLCICNKHPGWGVDHKSPGFYFYFLGFKVLPRWFERETR